MTESLPDLAGLLPSWELALKAERKAPRTIKIYADGVKKFLRWCAENGQPAELTRTSAQAFLADLIDAGMEANTAKSRDLALKRYAAWLVDEGELSSNPLIGLKPPKGDKKVVHALTDEQLKRLVAACKGNSLQDRRDEAIMRFMAETGVRASEVTAMQVEDMNVHEGKAIVRRGKGGKGRVVPFGVQTAAVIERYIRARKAHRLAETGALWLGGGGKGLGYYGLDKALKGRAAAAGVEGFHLHIMRHTFATKWLRAKGSESGLMAVAGWSNRDMIDRYTGASASERAAEEARTLGLGDL
jgi:integrase/recombinase XerD